MSNPTVRAEALQRIYRSGGRETVALDDVSLTVEPGQMVAIVGRSGSGKTTLLNLLGGLDWPTGGAVWIDGQNLAHLHEYDLTQLRRGKIGYVFQSFGLLPLLSAEENVDLPLRIAGIAGPDRAIRVSRALEEVGLGDRRRHRPDELSGGEQQRVAIARVIATRPAIILADEPTAELDSANARAVFSLLREIVDRSGAAMVVATHDRSLLDLASVVFELRHGKLEKN